MKIHKRLAALLLALTLCFGFTATAYAHEVPDMNRTGSISAKTAFSISTTGIIFAATRSFPSSVRNIFLSLPLFSSR